MAFLLRQPSLQNQEPFVRFAGALTDAECDLIIAVAQALPEQQATVGEGTVDPQKRRTKLRWLHWSQDVDWLYQKLAGICADVQQNWYPFHLAGLPEPLQVAHYEAQDAGHYDWHKDLGAGSMGPRKLSLVAMLSDPADFSGGALQMMGLPGPDHTVENFDRGTILALPAWEYHRVAPVTAGTRCSLVAWVHGHPFA